MLKKESLTKYIPPIVIGSGLGFVILLSISFPDRWKIATLSGVFFVLIGLSFFKHLEEILYACFVIFLPLQLGKSFFYVPYLGGGNELRINLPEIFFAILIMGWLAGLIRTQKGNIIDRKLLICSGLFLFISFLSLGRAVNISLGVFELFRSLIAFLIFIFIAYYVDSEKKLNQTIIFLLLGSLPQICSGLYQWLFQKDLGLYFFGEFGLAREAWAESPLVRVGGLIGHPNAFATYLLLTLPFCIIYCFRGRRLLKRAACFSLLVIGTYTLISTQSRAGWLGFTVAVVVTSIIFIVSKRWHTMRLWPITIGILIFFIIIGTSSYGIIENRINLDDRGAFAGRFPMMIDALNIIEKNPLLGIGMNNYALVIGKYDTTGIHREWVATPVHNLYLLIGAESGLFAMFAFISFWVLILWKVRKLFSLHNKNYFLLGLAFTMSLVAFLIISQAHPNYRFYPAIQREIWLIAGLVVAAYNLARKDTDQILSP
jgi:O-antigen ligase